VQGRLTPPTARGSASFATGTGLAGNGHSSKKCRARQWGDFSRRVRTCEANPLGSVRQGNETIFETGGAATHCARGAFLISSARDGAAASSPCARSSLARAPTRREHKSSVTTFMPAAQGDRDILRERSWTRAPLATRFVHSRSSACSRGSRSESGSTTGPCQRAPTLRSGATLCRRFSRGATVTTLVVEQWRADADELMGPDPLRTRAATRRSDRRLFIDRRRSARTARRASAAFSLIAVQTLIVVSLLPDTIRVPSRLNATLCMGPA
jgi:hypothetical protein